MKKDTTRGFLLIEGLIVAAITALVTTAIAGIYFSVGSVHEHEVRDAQMRFLAQEGLDAIRSVRDENPSSFGAGTFGIATTTSAWTTSGSSDVFASYTRSVEVIENSADVYLVTANVGNGVATKTTQTLLTNWQIAPPAPASLVLDTSVVAISGGSKRISGLNIENTGGDDFDITSVDVSWSGVASNIKLNQIRIDGTKVWDVKETSPVSANITDTIIAAGSTEDLELRFSKNITGITVTITLYASNGESITETFTP